MSYNTRQRELILDYIKKNAKKHLTADDIADEQQCHDHFHMKCLKCGRLFHLECDHLKDIAAHISKMHDFTIDSSRTVFYGICGECAKKTPTAKEKSDI